MGDKFARVIRSPVLRSEIRNLFGNQETEVTESEGAYTILLKIEPAEEVKRIIVLKPHGFTSTSRDVLSCHPDTREATIKVRGIARGSNKGYYLAKKCVEFIYFLTREAAGEALSSLPYVQDKNALRVKKNPKETFKVVKASGFGFYHNIINLTGEWVVIVLSKKLNLAKKVDRSTIKILGETERKTLLSLEDELRKKGYMVFEEDAALIKKICGMRAESSLPALISFLNIQDRGKREPCTVFAIILRVARKERKASRRIILDCLKNDSAPPYYLKELLEKT